MCTFTIHIHRCFMCQFSVDQMQIYQYKQFFTNNELFWTVRSSAAFKLSYCCLPPSRCMASKIAYSLDITILKIICATDNTHRPLWKTRLLWIECLSEVFFLHRKSVMLYCCTINECCKILNISISENLTPKTLTY